MFSSDYGIHHVNSTFWFCVTCTFGEFVDQTFKSLIVYGTGPFAMLALLRACGTVEINGPGLLEPGPDTY